MLERLGNKVEINLPWTGQLFFAFKIPEIYWEYSTKRVLTMEFCEGGKVDDLPYMQSFKISSDEASKNIKTSFLFRSHVWKSFMQIYHIYLAVSCLLLRPADKLYQWLAYKL